MSLNSQSLLADPSKSAATATHTQVDDARPSDVSGRDGEGAGVGAGTPRNMSSSSTPPTSNKREEFRKRVGIPDDGTKTPHIDLERRRKKNHLPRSPSPSTLPPDTTITTAHTLSAHLEKAYRVQTRYYYLVASASHGMLWLQIGIGATVTAIGSTNSNAARIAITVLGAINTVLAGMLTFLKSRNQPNRALQFRNGLRDVYEDLWQVDAETCRSDFDVDKKVDYLWGKYKEVVADSEANYPDLWVSLSNSKSGKSQSQSQPQNGSRKGSTASSGATTPPPSLEVRAPLLANTVP
ncbi:hypothetical protein A1O7_09645 [Cladophialophora yegresii CBS 114405]|uniref:SMODS and SLOG-associating 2TM effector domain-containing protein n=1 Tax=Cladophialophora yegresii CBS 114405 TaxID=1182544 RepID=W9VFA5_9EURO|nr:uncharacterized protein A1O7_09645 [Cladophialophora yegresii CBS 114405]EXJ54307.1 hypothetical protein A1O7_09645 [Cladophialophora yegresii CBS 114405]